MTDGVWSVCTEVTAAVAMVTVSVDVGPCVVVGSDDVCVDMTSVCWEYDIVVLVSISNDSEQIAGQYMEQSGIDEPCVCVCVCVRSCMHAFPSAGGGGGAWLMSVKQQARVGTAKQKAWTKAVDVL